MGRTVLLHHQLPDGSGHLDWLIERPGSAGLLSFRVRVRLDDERCREFDAESMPDHRQAYLDYEGPVSGGRGTVLRVAAGRAEVESASTESVVVVMDFGQGQRRAVGTPVSAEETGGPGRRSGHADRWVFTLTPLERTGAAR